MNKPKNPIAITGIWLRGSSTSSHTVELLVEINGQWRLVGDEFVGTDARILASHIWETSGIAKAPKDPLS